MTVPPGTVARCRTLLMESVERNMGDSIMFSGGLDTTIMAHLSVIAGAKPACYTVAFTEADAPDIPFARSVARKLGLEWNLLRLTPEMLNEELPQVIRILKTFDPMEVRNGVAVYHGLLAAREEGFSKAMTGDAADELFAGYSFSFNLRSEELMDKLRALWRVMHFSSGPMAAGLSMSASLPFLDPAVAAFAATLGPSDLVGVHDSKKFGKLILREAFEEMIGSEVAWRVKTPIEYGSGTTHLPRFYEARVSDEAFRAGVSSSMAKDGVKIRDKEHLQYYSFYRSIFLPPSATATTRCRCPDCGGDVRPESRFCTTCGSYPIAPVITS